MTASDWKDFSAILGTVVGVPGVLFAAYKGWRELKKSNEQRHEELERQKRAEQLRRAEFTLGQLRRLFEDPDLLAMLPLLDLDDPKLADFQMLNAKRKFLTFCEEIALLVNSGFFEVGVAHYMFGYYVTQAHKGKNFRSGMAYKTEHWGLFMKFAEDAEQYLQSGGASRANGLRL